MDQSGNWRRTFHRVWQPNMQRKLRRLADRPAEDQKRGDCDKCRVTRQARHPWRDFRKNDRASRHPNHQDSDHESKITYASGDEGLVARIGGCVAIEQIGRASCRERVEITEGGRAWYRKNY